MCRVFLKVSLYVSEYNISCAVCEISLEEGNRKWGKGYGRGGHSTCWVTVLGSMGRELWFWNLEHDRLKLVVMASVVTSPWGWIIIPMVLGFLKVTIFHYSDAFYYHIVLSFIGVLTVWCTEPQRKPPRRLGRLSSSNAPRQRRNWSNEKLMSWRNFITEEYFNFTKSLRRKMKWSWS